MPMTTTATNAMINAYSTRPWPRSWRNRRSSTGVLQFYPNHTCPSPLQRRKVRRITTPGRNTVTQRGGHQEGGAESRPPGRCGQARGPSATQAEGPGKAGAVGQGPGAPPAGFSLAGTPPGGRVAGSLAQAAAIQETLGGSRRANGCRGRHQCGPSPLRSSTPTHDRSRKVNAKLDTRAPRGARTSSVSHLPKTAISERHRQPTAAAVQHQVQLAGAALLDALTREQVITALIGRISRDEHSLAYRKRHQNTATIPDVA
jgi:hypothetical protein